MILIIINFQNDCSNNSKFYGNIIFPEMTVSYNDAVRIDIKILIKQKMSVKSRQNPQIHQKCKKTLSNKQEQFKNKMAVLEQKIQFLEEQLKEYRQREADNKKINQSIMITYQQSQSIREEHISRSIKMMTQKHREQLGRIKEAHYRETKILQQTISQLKDRLQQALIQNDRRSVQLQKKYLQQRKKYEHQYKKQQHKKQQEYQQKLQKMKEKVKQSQNLAQLYKQFMQKRRQTVNSNYPNQISYNNYINYDDEFDNTNLRSKQVKQGRNSVLKESLQQNHSILVRKQDNQHNKQNRNRLLQECQHPSYAVSRRSRIQDIQENNIKDMKRLSVSRQSVKQLTVKIQRAITHLKGSNHHKLHQRINQKLLKRL